MPLHVVLAPNALKECLDARQVASALRRGVISAYAEAQVSEVPLADGGDGMLAAFESALGGRSVWLEAQDPLGRPLRTRYLLLADGTAVVEMALVSGLALLKVAEQNPLLTSTYGMGQVLRHALENGVRRFIVGIGGSATNDAGTGMAQALGYRWLGLTPDVRACGGLLGSIIGLDAGAAMPQLAGAQFKVACDVKNPLLGPTGSSRVFAPQKGASPADVEKLEAAMARFSEVMSAYAGRDESMVEGVGAAGGIGFMFKTLLQGTLVSGAELMLEQSGFMDKLKTADLVITAEGRLDGQTARGKLPAVVARVAREHGVPCLALAGSLGQGWQSLQDSGLCALAIAPGPVTLEDSMANAADYLADTCREAVRIFLMGRAKG